MTHSSDAYGSKHPFQYSKLRTYPMDPRDVSSGEWVSGERRRRSMDEAGEQMWKHPSTDALQALMEARPDTEPQVGGDDPPFSVAMQEALATLSDLEYDVVMAVVSVRQYAEMTGLSKSTVHRARQNALSKLRNALGG